jgi:hypothetical protein
MASPPGYPEAPGVPADRLGAVHLCTNPVAGQAASGRRPRRPERAPGRAVAAGLLVADTLRAIGYDDDAIAAAVGVDLAAVEGATPEEALAALERGVPAFARLVENGAPVG